MCHVLFQVLNIIFSLNPYNNSMNWVLVLSYMVFGSKSWCHPLAALSSCVTISSYLTSLFFSSLT